MPEQFSLFNSNSRTNKALNSRIKVRKNYVLKYRNGARVEGMQDKYGIFWAVKIEHKDRVAFTTVRDQPEKGDPEIERLIKTLEHH